MPVRPLRSPIVVALVVVINGAPPAAAQRGHEGWTISDVVLREQVTNVMPSPDGTRVLWLRHAADAKKDRFVPKLWMWDAASGKRRALTHGLEGESSPAWSPSGQRIAFLSARKAPARPKAGDEAGGGGADGEGGDADGDKDDEKPQVWVMRLDGGEPAPVTAFKDGVKAFRWISERELLVAARERRTWREVLAKKRKDESVVVEDSEAFKDEAVRLFRVPAGDGDDGEEKAAKEAAPKEAGAKGADEPQVDRVTTNPDQVSTFEVAPDGSRVVYVRIVSPTWEVDERHPPRVFLRDLRSGEERELFAERKSRPASFAWRPDSRGFYALAPVAGVDGQNMAAMLVVDEVDAASGAVARVPLEWPPGVASDGLAPTRDGFLALLRQGVRNVAVRFVREGAGWRREPLTGADAVSLHELRTAALSNAVVYVSGTASQPDRWRRAMLEASALIEERDVIPPPKGLDGKAFARTEVLRWKGALDEEVEGLLYLPRDHDASKPAPLIVMPHGGPYGASADRFEDGWAYAPNLYAQKGALCLYLNYHGSEGYGLAFGESIKGRYYELEIVDILAGVDRLVKDGRADPERLALAGWSNGAILSIACLTLADVYAPQYRYSFRACVPGAGDVNWISDYGNCAFGVAFDDYYLGGPPWKLPELYLKKSPLFHVEKVRTPTLIFFGDKDTSVPTSQGWEWYRALQQLGQAPVRFVLFPGEPHGLRKVSSRRRKLEEEAAWLDQWLFGAPPKPPAMAESAPLAWALAAKEYARQGRRYGVLVNDVLAPETVPLEGMLVGRFEVTRAQWQAMFAETAVDPAEADWPMTAVSADDAGAYVKRLSEKSGRAWRLLRESEFEKLPAGPEENTLDWWAGFELPPEAAAAIRSRAADLAGDGSLPPLVRPVGSQRPGIRREGDTVVRIHDAGGNVAEWVLDAAGKPVLRGGCAFLSDDDRARPGSTPAAYAGLRVALEPPAK